MTIWIEATPENVEKHLCVDNAYNEEKAKDYIFWGGGLMFASHAYDDGNNLMSSYDGISYCLVTHFSLASDFEALIQLPK